MASDQFKVHGEAVLEDLVAGLTEEEAAQKREISANDPGLASARPPAPYGPYGGFAKAVHRARRERRFPPGAERPLDRDELLLVVSRSARQRSVRAPRLMWEIIHTNDPFEFEDDLERLIQGGRGPPSARSFGRRPNAPLTARAPALGHSGLVPNGRRPERGS
jgi:hypothetical protein